MNRNPDTVPDDARLARLLAECGATQSPAEVRALIAGVAAAPPPIEADAWMRLVAAEPTPALRAALAAIEAEARAADDGLRPGPVPGERLAALRAELAKRDLAGFLVPRADPHHGEYLPRDAERLQWLTGFSGSAGIAVVLAETAAVFVDGRYTVQVAIEADGALFEHRHVTDEPPADWLAERLKPGDRLGFDPWLHTPDGIARIREACERTGAMLVACDDNPIDRVWRNRPPSPIAPVVPHDIAYAGEDAAAKRARVAEAVRDAGAGAAILSAPDSIAWLLNIRGGDVPYCPLPLAFAIIDERGRVDLFADRRKLVPELAAHLGEGVVPRPPETLGAALDALGQAGVRLLADPGASAVWVFERMARAGGEIARGADPCALPRACKNETEIAGARAAHLRDGAALARFLAWLDANAPREGLGEVAAAARLDAFRAEGDLYRGPSFPTIAGAGPNGAIVHYRASERSDRMLAAGDLFLVDSGGQYLDGTTDVTRTVAIGAPDADRRRHFTAVLKGHIALATAVFPAGTTGSQIDAFARRALWALGLDFDHGTGHGVGSYLGVHEGPQRISKLPNRVALGPGMIVSNEPGYYREGAYGIRIENLVCVTPRPDLDAEREMLGFETLTLAPLDRRLIDVALLERDEIDWIDAYHARVRAALTPRLDPAAARWLAQATRPLAEG